MMKKTKEVLVAIAESSIGKEPQQQKRKRGRPRKTVENIEEIKTAAAAAEYEGVLEGESNKAETIEGEEDEKKEELLIEETQMSRQQPPRSSSRARRKSKPRKSS